MTSCNDSAAGPLPTTPGGFACILADPPWAFATWSKTRQTRAAENHYAVMSLDNICAMPVADVAAPDAVLLLWSVNPMLPQALRVIDAWGFAYKTTGFVWAKRTPTNSAWHMGMGYWSRQNTETCLLATLGKPKRLSAAVRQLIVAPRREHSRKPDEQYERIEALCPGPRLELFARHRRPGWTAWGNQLPPYDPTANGLNTYALACQLAREGDAGVRQWFSGVDTDDSQKDDRSE